jgi:hypothetical protein
MNSGHLKTKDELTYSPRCLWSACFRMSVGARGMLVSCFILYTQRYGAWTQTLCCVHPPVWNHKLEVGWKWLMHPRVAGWQRTKWLGGSHPVLTNCRSNRDKLRREWYCSLQNRCTCHQDPHVSAFTVSGCYTAFDMVDSVVR